MEIQIKVVYMEGPKVAKPLYIVRFEVFTVVTMKNGVFWVVTPCGPAYVG
jgi:hypothetical protein